MGTTFVIQPEQSDVIEDAIFIIEEKAGIRIHKKDIFLLVFKNPKEIAEIALRNLKTTL